MEHMFEESLLYTTNQSYTIVFGGDDDHQLCKTLLSKGHKIIYVGFSKQVYQSIRYITCNLLEPIRIDGDISEVYYTLKPEENDILLTIKTCIIGTINVLEFARQKQAIVHISKPAHFEYMNICDTIIQEYVEKHGLSYASKRRD